jgi:hypothetical protein
MHAPYSESGLKAVGTRLLAFLEIARVLLPPVLVFLASVLMVTARNQPVHRIRYLATLRDEIVVIAAPIVAIELGSLLLGQNRGYLGRMQFLALPFASVRVFV